MSPRSRKLLIAEQPSQNLLQRHNLEKKQKLKLKKRKKQKPRKTLGSVDFKNTPLGYYLSKYCPLEYKLITDAFTKRGRLLADFVESISYISNNPAFKTTEFRQALADFRRYKCKTPNSKRFDMKVELETIKKQLGIS